MVIGCEGSNHDGTLNPSALDRRIRRLGSVGDRGFGNLIDIAPQRSRGSFWPIFCKTLPPAAAGPRSPRTSTLKEGINPVDARDDHQA